MDQQEVVNRIVHPIENHPAVEGAYLCGSLVNEHRDRFSDVDVGIASGDSGGDIERAYTLREPMLAAIGTPVHVTERGWEHCRMIAALYGKTLFPPVGLEVDLVFSQLQHVSEQMPYAQYMILLDRHGELKRELDRIGRPRPNQVTAQEIRQHLKGLPFVVHDALKAHGRGDVFHFQSLLDELRTAVFFVAAARQGGQVFGSKHAARYLSAAERQAIEASYREFSRQTLEHLLDLYLSHLEAIRSEYGLETDVAHFQTALRELV
ncbi:MAG TPA: hypothetical protein VMT24_12640 [Aggregatilineaceae bacterium]|nr:hypothetical protein [Aggregatilineaceae bacterium]